MGEIPTHISIMESIIDKLKKIKELVDRGYKGEQQAAMEMFDRLVEKYNIDPEDIFTETTKEYEFRYYSSTEKDILLQCYGKVIEKSEINYKPLKDYIAIFKLTQLQYIHLKELYKFHKKNYSKEYKEFVASFSYAYKSKHSLLIQRDPDDTESVVNELLNFDKIRAIKNSLNNVSFNKLLKK